MVPTTTSNDERTREGDDEDNEVDGAGDHDHEDSDSSAIEPPDPLALPRHKSSTTPGARDLSTITGYSNLDGTRIHCDITHSPTYQVPVLYLTFPSPAYPLANEKQKHSPLPPAESVFDLLVPGPYQAQLRNPSAGPTNLPALSLTGAHPGTDGPAYFLHPCRTQEGMERLLAVDLGGEEEGLRYLGLWMGLVGPGVGLGMPMGMFADGRGRTG